jgi:very-short-patch-repair endonuclease
MNKLKARDLRKNLTDAERILWQHLRLRQMGEFKFRRQQPIDNYIVDFVCFERRLIVEIDGGHHSEQPVRDAKRDEWLKKQGFAVLRFWNNEVLKEIEAVKEKILSVLDPCSNPPPSSSPAGGEEIPDTNTKPKLNGDLR